MFSASAAPAYTITDFGIDTACSGYFFDIGGFAGNYYAGIQWYTLYASAGNTLIVTFNTFNLANGILRIHDGNSVTSPTIGTYQNNNSPGTIIATNGCLFFDFQATGNTFASGWQATISCTPVCSAHFIIYPDTTTPHNWFALNQASGGIPPITYSWNWGDGSANSNGPTPSHTYSTPGYYNICLTTTDAIGCVNTYCDSSTYISRGNSSNTMITINAVVADIVEQSASQQKIYIYPNPATSSCTITFPINDATLSLYDVTGRIQLQQPFNTQAEINISTLTSGVYIVEVKDKEGRSVKGKVVKE